MDHFLLLGQLHSSEQSTETHPHATPCQRNRGLGCSVGCNVCLSSMWVQCQCPRATHLWSHVLACNKKGEETFWTSVTHGGCALGGSEAGSLFWTGLHIKAKWSTPTQDKSRATSAQIPLDALQRGEQ